MLSIVYVRCSFDFLSSSLRAQPPHDIILKLGRHLLLVHDRQNRRSRVPLALAHETMSNHTQHTTTYKSSWTHTIHTTAAQFAGDTDVKKYLLHYFSSLACMHAADESSESQIHKEAPLPHSRRIDHHQTKSSPPLEMRRRCCSPSRMMVCRPDRAFGWPLHLNLSRGTTANGYYWPSVSGKYHEPPLPRRWDMSSVSLEPSKYSSCRPFHLARRSSL